MNNIKNGILILLLISISISCKKEYKKEEKEVVVSQKEDIVSTIIEDKDNFYHLDFTTYPREKQNLPIGVFDSGTGGLTVLKAIVEYDQHNNSTKTKGSDSLLDFAQEFFIYLGDQANMPYGNYAKENKIDLLKEHIIKDAQFLMGNKYYTDREDQTIETNKLPVKVLVVACNTATAYGKEYIEDFLKKAGSDVKVIGVIDAGVRGTLAHIEKEEDAVIGVLATAGTVASKGYHNTLLKYKKEMGYTGMVEVFSQGGIGIAEAIDNDPDYFDKTLRTPRKEYKGPGLEGDVKINQTLFDVYNFDFDHNRMLCKSGMQSDCEVLQINDAENYVRYHLVTLLEKIRISKTPHKLKALILGCTHYPYMENEINKVLNELYQYKDSNGKYVYQGFMEENIVLVDPAVDTAKELFYHLKDDQLFNPNGQLKNSEFYISVPNKQNTNTVIDSLGRFPYDYKYGRQAGEIQEYVKVVPFSRNNIPEDILTRFQQQIPKVYKLMKHFNQNNTKAAHLNQNSKI
ncbi:glutamate racemase [Aquimarina megaterium]|uniref:glutamate racemase n=1 Tax=Aquimarina megaterium TaxID=1443666 RepID=UPI0004708B7D|nr:aspartate/glutamate racemase family protein [Aquimarina megaterium]